MIQAVSYCGMQLQNHGLNLISDRSLVIFGSLLIWILKE